MYKVLIVDDQVDIRRMMSIALEGDFELLEAEDGVTALKLVRVHKPQVVLLDVMMPGKLDGLDLCRLVKSDPALGHPQVVLLSARGQSQDIEAGMNAGADAYLLKPFSPLKLIETIAQLDGAHGGL